MRLAKVQIRGFRKLVETECRFSGKLTAVVGPNEAGKSSLLELLLAAQTDEAIPHAARPRGLDVQDSEMACELWYRLENSDLEAIAQIETPDEAEWYIVTKKYEGGRTHRIEPRLTRDQSTRRAAHSALSRFADTRYGRGLDRTEEKEGLGDHVDQVLDVIQGTEDLGDAQWSQVLLVAQGIDSDDAPASARNVAKRLVAWHERCSGDGPQSLALDIFDKREPRVVMFGSAQRDLRSAYSIEDEADAPSPALGNLATLADLDLRALRDAYINDDPGSAETATEAANATLRDRVNDAWQQSDVDVHLRHDGGTLRVLVRTDAPSYSTVAERSDGLKTFVALTAFAHQVGDAQHPIVLLIDEAEQHLHYDAQADVVRMLERQSVAPQVIYTTHSAGCLPTDLGTGVRAVVPIADQGRSHVANSLWQSGAGFSPLIMALGAGVAAFAPSRYAAIGEGATEMLLLPTLIREAIQQDRLIYQVAPGLAQVGNDALRELDLEAPRVVYVVDGDAGGTTHAERLVDSGVSPSHIVHIGGVNSGLAIEDLVREDVYIAAANDVLRQLGHRDQISKSTLDRTKARNVALDALCIQRGLPRPGKPAVAVAILEIEAGRLLTRDGSRALRTLHKEILAGLEVPSG